MISHRIRMALTLVILISLACSPALAHPPQDMQLDYDLNTGTLHVTIQHIVSDPSDHYVNEVVVMTQGKKFENYPYTIQPDSRSFTYTYQVQAVQGEEITVRAVCNKAGSFEKSIRSSEGTDGTTGSNSGPSTSTPGFESVITIIAVLCICVFIHRSG